MKRPLPTLAVPSSFTPGGWAGASEEIHEENLLWRQYVLLVDLYRYYIDLVWRVTIWFYTATGLSLAYILTHLNSRNHGYLPLLLLFLGAMAFRFDCQAARMWTSYAGSADSSAELSCSSRHLVSDSMPIFKSRRHLCK